MTHNYTVAAQYYLQPSCGNIPETLRYCYGIGAEEVASIARGIVIGLMGAGRKSAKVDIYEIDDNTGGRTFVRTIC